jgi:hypothetical protein
MKYHLNNLSKVSGIVATLLLSACASKPPAVAETRYVGFKESLTLNTKTLHSDNELIEYSYLMGKADFSTRPGSRTWFAAHQSGVIITREFITGSLAENFGKRTELILKIQPCFNTVTIDHIITCKDSNPGTVMTNRNSLTLKGGETVVAKFPNGMEWTYTVLDQDQPY